MKPEEVDRSRSFPSGVCQTIVASKMWIKCDANEAELVPWGIAIVLNCFELLITKRSSLDSIRFEACDMPSTLSLFKTVRARDPLRRANFIILEEIEAETAGFRSV